MKTKIYTITLTVLTALLFTACESFLDAFPQDQITDNNFWKTENDAQKMLIDIYSATLPTSNIFWMETMSDNAYLTWSWWGGYQQIANGTHTTYGGTSQDVWKARYECIRKCWFLLENIDKIPFTNDDTKEQIIAETRFLLAYSYHMLAAYFGDVPLVKKTMSLEESKQLVRDTKETVIAFIIEELDKAATALKGKDQEWGRITWGACQTLKARVYLYENNYPKVLETVETLKGKYSLNTVGVTPYEDLFSGAAERSDEIILSVICDKMVGGLSVGHSGNGGMLLKGMSGDDPYCGLMPAGSLVDAYPMADGKLIKESGSTYVANSPYTDRDPRLYQSIVYPTAQMKCLDPITNTITEKLYDPEDPSTTPEQLYNAREPSPTGYMWRKYVDFSVYGMNQIWDCINDIIIFRYADVLLMEAEALCETQGAGAKTQICDLIDQLRNRCKGGRVHRENYNSTEELRHLIRNERRIELANEGFRYFDLIRWKDAEKNTVATGYGLAGEMYGAYMRLDGIGKDDRTVTVDGAPRRYVETRHFDVSKHYLLPIPQSERDLNSSLTQNPNW